MTDLLDPRRSPNHRPTTLGDLLDRSIARWERQGRLRAISKPDGVAEARRKRDEKRAAQRNRRAVYLARKE
jgi:hypothetical protein